jgi:hypothetical protein
LRCLKNIQEELPIKYLDGGPRMHKNRGLETIIWELLQYSWIVNPWENEEGE